MQNPYNDPYGQIPENDEAAKKRKEEDEKKRFRLGMRKKALEIICYVIGAGAFSIFIRWLQLMLAFNDDGLVDGSIFNALVILVVFAAGYIFLRFTDTFRAGRYYVPDDFYKAFANPGKLYKLIRWALGLIMTGGALLLLISSETDKNGGFYRVLAFAGAVSGLAYPLLLTSANKPRAPRPGLSCFCAFMPLLMFCIWLITCYKVNSINSVMWDYAPEAAAVIASIIAFFRMAGYPFSSPNCWRSMFFAMLASTLDLMVLADSRYIGQQLMFFAAAMMLALYVWLMICNMERREAPEKEQPNDGFERL